MELAIPGKKTILVKKSFKIAVRTVSRNFQGSQDDFGHLCVILGMVALYVTGQCCNIRKEKFANFAGEPTFGQTVDMLLVGVPVQFSRVTVLGAAKVTKKSFGSTGCSTGCHRMRIAFVFCSSKFCGEVSGAAVTAEPVEHCQVQMV